MKYSATFAEAVRAHCAKHKYSATYATFWLTHPRCEVTGCGLWSAAPHHVRTRGAGGDDSPLNLFALCTTHHSEIGQLGNGEFGLRHPEMAHKIRAALDRPKVVG